MNTARDLEQAAEHSQNIAKLTLGYVLRTAPDNADVKTLKNSLGWDEVLTRSATIHCGEARS